MFQPPKALEPFRVIICGGRDYSDYETLCRVCDYQLQNRMRTHKVIIVCGRARGADTLGAQWAKDRGLDVENFPADWIRFGKRAGILRNTQMAEVANACIAFKGGAGTANMVEQATARGLIVRVVAPKAES
jgi:hypothetical protein